MQWAVWAAHPCPFYGGPRGPTSLRLREAGALVVALLIAGRVSADWGLRCSPRSASRLGDRALVVPRQRGRCPPDSSRPVRRTWSRWSCGVIVQVEAPDALGGRVPGARCPAPRVTCALSSGRLRSSPVGSGSPRRWRLTRPAGAALLAWRRLGGRSGTRETGVSANEVHEEWEAGVAGLDSVGVAPETAKPLIARREPGGESVGG